MKCEQAQERLPLYLAQELSDTEQARIQKHLEECPTCREMAEALTETHEHLETAFADPIEASPSLDVRIMAAVRALPPRQKPWQRWFPIPPAEWLAAQALAAACLLCLGFLWGGSRTPNSPDPLGRTLATSPIPFDRQDYDRLLSDSQQVRPTSTTPETTSQALTQQVRFPVQAVDLQPEGAQLVGGTSATVQGAPVAVLHYDLQGKRVVLIQTAVTSATPTPTATPGVSPPAASPERYFVERHAGLTRITWRTGNTRNILFARALPMHTLFQLACHACERQERI